MVPVLPWWQIWEGMIAEYWSGTRRLMIEDLGGDLGLAVMLSPDHRLLIAMDHATVEVLAEDDRLRELSIALRDLLTPLATYHKPPLYGYWRLSLELKRRRRLWQGDPASPMLVSHFDREGER